jgi:hypothetical protein
MKKNIILLLIFTTTFLQAQGFNQYDRLWGTYFGPPLNNNMHIIDDEQGNVITFYGFSHNSITQGSTSIYNYVRNFIYQSNEISDYLITDTNFTYFAKFNPEGVLLQSGVLPYSVKDIQKDQDQNILILGETNRTNYGTLNTWLPTTTTLPISGQTYGLIIKLDQQLNKLWCSYLPIKYYWGNEQISNLTIDENNNIYGTGQTLLRTGITTENPYDSTTYQINSFNTVNTLLYKLNSNGVLQWATYYGLAFPTAIEAKDDVVYLALLVDEDELEDSNLPTNYYITPSAYQNTSSSIVLSKFNANTGQRIASTYFGGESFEGIQSIKRINGSTYIFGDVYNMNSSNTWITDNAYQTMHGGAIDLYLGKLDDNFTPIWGTYIGGSGNEKAKKINYKDQYIYFSGYTSSPNITLTENTYSNVISGDNDALIMKFNLDGNLIWGSYFGSDNYDNSYTILPIDDQTFYINGITLSNKDITTPGAHRYDFSYYSFPYMEYSATNPFLIKFGRNDDLSTSDISTSTLKIYPNPTKDKVYIKGFIHQDSWIEVYNLVGQKVVTQKAKSGLTQEIEVQFIPKGTYIIKVTDINGKVFQDKLLIN